MGNSENAAVSTVHAFQRAARAKSAANHAEKRLIVLGQSGSADEFDRMLGQHALSLRKAPLEILQINLGKLCNLTCEHCHVEAGPDRKEVMSQETMYTLVEVARRFSIRTIDFTGGAPEMVPGFRDLVKEFSVLDCHMIVRSNLTILLEPGYEDLIDFFVRHKLHVIASLPCYTKENVDRQRGEGVFEGSIAALKLMNDAGYGRESSGLILDLVYNPGGPSLPGPQKALEAAYKEQLFTHSGVEFNSLFTITNLPIGRFYSDLKKLGKAAEYKKLLQENFNAKTVPHLMCRNTLNVSWDGWVYDCDFNQMIELPSLVRGRPVHVSDFTALERLWDQVIATGNHCFGCTAGAGSSCGGELVIT